MLEVCSAELALASNVSDEYAEPAGYEIHDITLILTKIFKKSRLKKRLLVLA